MSVPPDYETRVYAGVLGKMIGVYLGRPFEGWTYERILETLGEITYYVHDQLGAPLIVTDDDLTGTFTFLRALPDHGNRRDLTPAQIGESWLNYIIEGKTILWWGGLGYATEHTAYLRLKRGVRAPESGSMARNGKTIAEQIGAQIFIDGWAMVAPDDPPFAAELARRAASVSHDGEAVHAAMLWAAMESAAFVESDLMRLMDTSQSVIPRDSLIRHLMDQIREKHAMEPDWRAARAWLAAHYGYDKYRGACHVVPNHGVMLLSLLYGEGDFCRTQTIVNTCGWDTDCNAGNVGCLLGIRGGLAAFEGGPDWRGPLADRLYLSSAEGGRGITDALRESYFVVNSGRALAGLPPVLPKDGARFHFSLPGSVQGFTAADPARCTVENVAAPWQPEQRCLRISGQGGGRAFTPTFIPPEAIHMKGYALLAAPTLYPGQVVTASVIAGDAPAAVGLYLDVYGDGDALVGLDGPSSTLGAAESGVLEWIVPDTDGAPIARIGLKVDGAVYVDRLTWNGAPRTTFKRAPGSMWRRAWVDGVYRVRDSVDYPFMISQNDGTGLLMTGASDWRDVQVSAAISPALCKAAGLAVRVQGLRRFYGLLLCSHGKARLVRGPESVLAECAFDWEYDREYPMRLAAHGARIQGWIDDQLVFSVEDEAYLDGGIALVVDEGSLAAGEIHVA
ncbi:MAG: ADP-ribosylglycohydrolase family protein [Anaerolineae bacterium]|nr:ADP-ribosylglycohydrolase family protein [Anaerolineae bacterium]